MTRRFRHLLPGLLAASLPWAMQAAESPEAAAFTTTLTSPIALQQAISGLPDGERERFARGRGLFNQIWIASPSLDTEVDGLGPTFNQSSCAACHLRNGRGAPPASPRERMRGMLVRLSIPGATDNGGPLPHPVYGEQLQDGAIGGVRAEGRAVVEWVEHEERFADGDTIMLRRPLISLMDLAFGEAPDLLTSPRIAPAVIGAGLLDAVPEARLEALAATARPDGISGRVNRVFDPTTGNVTVGRFGWKANAASLRQQTAAAFSGDLGISSVHLPAENCSAAQAACRAAPSDSPDITEAQLDEVILYQALLAVPAARDDADPEIRHGEELFIQAGCQHCHVPELESGPQALSPALANRRFAAYTDLLLHDMGEALGDGRPDFLAGGSEWKTPPLWGLGLIPTVNEHNTLLHDGRARGVLEAILWHGGEGESARERVRSMSRVDREALVRFVNSR